MKNKILAILSYLMLAMFVFSIIVQYNDPDPITWMSIYGASAILTVAFIRRKIHWLFPALLFTISVLWAISIEPNVWGYISFSDLFSAWEMKSILVEEGREMGGLLIVAAWSLCMSIISFKRRKRSNSISRSSEN